MPHFAFMHGQPYQIFKCLCIIVFYCSSYFQRLPIFTLVLCHNYMKYTCSYLSFSFKEGFFFFYFGDLYKFSSMPLIYDGVVIACYLLSKYVHLLVVADIGWVVVPLEDVLYTSHFSFVYVQATTYVWQMSPFFGGQYHKLDNVHPMNVRLS